VNGIEQQEISENQQQEIMEGSGLEGNEGGNDENKETIGRFKIKNVRLVPACVKFISCQVKAESEDVDGKNSSSSLAGRGHEGTFDPQQLQQQLPQQSNESDMMESETKGRFKIKNVSLLLHLSIPPLMSSIR
jgi:hypothetical protein